MSARDLYVVRTKQLVILGPMPLTELRQRFKRMEVTIGDEVCGSLGPWLRLDDLAGLKKYYPKLIIVMVNEIPGAAQVIQELQSKLKEKKTPEKKPRKALLLANVALFLVFLSFGVGGYYQIRKAKQSAVSLVKDVKVVMQQARGLHVGSKREAFRNLMDQHYLRLIQTMISQKSLNQDIQTLLKIYYFESGTHMGSEILPGKMFGIDELDRLCTDAGWKSFYESQAENLALFTNGENLDLKNFYYRVLLWDRQWLERRQANEWLGFGNPYAACVRVAERNLEESERADAFKRLPQEKHFLLLTILRDRFRVLSSSEAGIREVYRFATYSSPLVLLNCYDTTWTSEQLAQCEELRGQSHAVWEDFFNRILLDRALPARLTEVLDQGSKQIPRSGESMQILGMSYQEEQTFMGFSIQNGGDFASADQQTRSQFPNFFFNLSPVNLK